MVGQRVGVSFALWMTSHAPPTCPQSSLVGIVVPDPEVLPDFAAKLGVKGSLEELCQNQVRDPALTGILPHICLGGGSLTCRHPVPPHTEAEESHPLRPGEAGQGGGTEIL